LVGVHLRGDLIADAKGGGAIVYTAQTASERAETTQDEMT